MISIIIPAFNVQGYIKKCLESVRVQSYKELDVIVINDGSTDNTESVCRDICQVDDRFRLINKSNGGVSSARNLGLENARAEYIIFIDADDWIDEYYCENLVKCAKEYDWVNCGYVKVTSLGIQKYDVKNNMIFNGNTSDYFEFAFENGLFSSPCNKLYKKSIIGNQRFDEKIYLGEDLFFNMEYLVKSTRIIVINNNLYNYNCLNENSVTRNSFARDVDSIIEIYNRLVEFDKRFYSGRHSSLISKDFCLNGISVVQRIYYANSSYSNKKECAKKLFDSDVFEKNFIPQYDIKLQYRFIQHMCRKKEYCMLYVFFKIKSIVYSLIKM